MAQQSALDAPDRRQPSEQPMSIWGFGLEVGLDSSAWRRATKPRPYAVFLASSSTIRCDPGPVSGDRNLHSAHAGGPS
jgi:hypothetical protein